VLVNGSLGVTGQSNFGGTASFNNNVSINGSLIVSSGVTGASFNNVRMSANTDLSKQYTLIGYNSESYGSNFSNTVTLGLFTLYSSTDSTNNVAIGTNCLRSLGNGGSTANNYNTAVGASAGTNLNIGSYNSIFGSSSFSANGKTGSYNTIIGANSYFNANTTISPQGSYNTTLGYNTCSNGGTYSYSTAIGYNANPTTSNQIVLGTTAEYVYIPGTTQSTGITLGALVVGGGAGIGGNLNIGGTGNFVGNVYAPAFYSSSDYRLKKNITKLDHSFNLDKIEPVIYNKSPYDNIEIGFIAHELQEIYPYLVNGNKDSEEYQSINYNGLIGILVNEVKLLKKEISILKEKQLI
jgi:hypothetical protein